MEAVFGGGVVVVSWGVGRLLLLLLGGEVIICRFGLDVF
jgi:hypothetical protein